jgi:hypothetical protein
MLCNYKHPSSRQKSLIGSVSPGKRKQRASNLFISITTKCLPVGVTYCASLERSRGFAEVG